MSKKKAVKAQGPVMPKSQDDFDIDLPTWATTNQRCVVRDVLQIKGLERQIGRSLTDEEMEYIDNGEPIELFRPNGSSFWTHVILYRMPEDLMPDLAPNSIQPQPEPTYHKVSKAGYYGA
jgi:hypothetical protein